MASASIDQRDVYAARISLPRTGTWSARVVHEGVEPLFGHVSLEADGLVLEGTVQRSGIEGGRGYSLVQGGAGGLTRELPARFWRGGTIQLVLEDLMRETSESLVDDLELPLKSTRWSRSRTSGGAELDRVCHWLGSDVVWRLRRDGRVWLGREAWVNPDVEHIELERSPQDARLLIAPEGLVDIEPGSVLNGERVDSVVHRVEPSQLRTEVFLEA